MRTLAAPRCATETQSPPGGTSGLKPIIVTASIQPSSRVQGRIGLSCYDSVKFIP